MLNFQGVTVIVLIVKCWDAPPPFLSLREVPPKLCICSGQHKSDLKHEFWAPKKVAKEVYFSPYFRKIQVDETLQFGQICLYITFQLLRACRTLQRLVAVQPLLATLIPNISIPWLPMTCDTWHLYWLMTGHWSEGHNNNKKSGKTALRLCNVSCLMRRCFANTGSFW